MLLLCLVCCGLVAVSGYRNNVCKRIRDYDTKLYNKNCWYNPDVDLTVDKIIIRHGYPLELHKAKTVDGYILQIFRIPHENKHHRSQNQISKRQPVFLQHGLLSSCAPWISTGNKSLGFLLADLGYDVWIGNSRGSTYGMEHANLSNKDSRYWNFSYHEMGTRDLPSSLDLVVKVTGRKDIIFIGQSMGSALPFVYGSMMPAHAHNRIKLIVSLAPAVFLGDMRTPFRIWTQYIKMIKSFTDVVDVHEFLQMSPGLKSTSTSLCLQSGTQVMFCEFLVGLLFGFSFEQFVPETFPIILAHYPAGMSVKTMFHMGQGVNTNKFKQYDYGWLLNLHYYNSTKPPEYDMSKINIPNYIMYSKNDFVATEQGAKLLYSKIRNKAGLVSTKNKKFNHADFFFGKDVVPVVYDEVIKILAKYTS